MNRTYRPLRLLALSVGCLAIVACGRPDPPGLVGDPAYPVYREYCHRCHGGHGDGRRASRVAKRRVDFGAPAFQDTTTLEAVARIIREGKGRMEGHAEDLTADQIEQLARLVKRFPFREAP